MWYRLQVGNCHTVTVTVYTVGSIPWVTPYLWRTLAMVDAVTVAAVMVVVTTMDESEKGQDDSMRVMAMAHRLTANAEAVSAIHGTLPEPHKED